MKNSSHRPPVTQKQIADELGVSRQLVSLVLNGTGRISETNRLRVQEAAQRLGYDANSNHDARAMIARRYSKRAHTGLIGCVCVSPLEDGAKTPLPYEAHLLHGIREEARQRGRDVLLLPPTPSSGWERVDGLLVHGKSATPVLERLGVDIPVVSMMDEMDGIPSVVPANQDGARQAVEHLLELGHRRIAYMVHVEGTPAIELRLEGYREALRARGITPRPEWIGELINLGPMILRGHHSMAYWLENGWKKLGCTALMVQNDRAAIGVTTALRQAGRRVPEDVSVVGFDSTDECEITAPRLTSIEVPLEEIGARAVGLLIGLIEKERDADAPQTITLPTRLQVRDSTCPPAASMSSESV